MLSMYPPPGIHFRNPFVDSRPSTSQTFANSHYKLDLDIQSPSGSAKVSFPSKKPLTPPPDMNSIASHVQPQHSSYYGERSSAAPVKYEHRTYDQPAYDQSQSQSQSHSQNQNQNQLHLPKPDVSAARPPSPVYQPHPVHFIDPPNQKRDSYMSAIAPSLQIPRSVNNSQGSIAELAAQITCLFWFESSSTLDRADDPATTYNVQSLVPEAIPTTGFRKWVTTILSTTQVTQNVIILALLFVYRLKKLNPSVKGKPGSEYRLLTVALMLGNKFLDDNTYTNKTWAEVSGISVAEVHIMEVEFLSNMKYALFTSAEEWGQWQNRLGRFASFFDRASRPMPQLPHTLPSPPTSNYASPPHYGATNPVTHSFPQYPSSLGPLPDLTSQFSRKRSLDTYTEPPAKRMAAYPTPAHNYTPRVTLPSLPLPQPTSHSSQHLPPQLPQLPQLPPLNYSHRPMNQVTQPPTSWTPATSIPAPISHAGTPAAITSVPQSVVHSRHQSPYPSSAAVSPTDGHYQPAGQAHVSQLSPSFFLAQRNSPYRPVRGVSTLLVPPPSRALQQPQNVQREQMHYQPLGRPQERQQGRLPYIESQWFEGNPSSNQWYSQTQHPQLPPTSFYNRG
ncbi:hypothetical protein D6D25_00678 [Aureobasidium pullulans]|nr:hypothetical protein D6D25_00678 [Aureobasidium pullulans]